MGNATSFIMLMCEGNLLQACSVQSLRNWSTAAKQKQANIHDNASAHRKHVQGLMDSETRQLVPHTWLPCGDRTHLTAFELRM